MGGRGTSVCESGSRAMPPPPRVACWALLTVALLLGACASHIEQSPAPILPGPDCPPAAGGDGVAAPQPDGGLGGTGAAAKPKAECPVPQ